MRLNKFLAHCGVASRRKCEQYIRRGRVQVNDEVVLDPALQIDPERDLIVYEGELQRLEEYVYYRYHKPAGQATTLSDPHIDDTLKPVVEEIDQRVYPVGRLDQDSRGLLILTNDGDVSHRISHPRYGVKKTYEVKLSRSPSAAVLRVMSDQGVHLEGEQTLPVSIEKTGDRSLRMSLREGRNRQIRRMFDRFDYEVVDLKRTKIGPVALDDLAPGDLEPLSEPEVDRLREVVSPS